MHSRRRGPPPHRRYQVTLAHRDPWLLNRTSSESVIERVENEQSWYVVCFYCQLLVNPVLVINEITRSPACGTVSRRSGCAGRGWRGESSALPLAAPGGAALYFCK